MPDELIDITTAAGILGCHRTTVHRLVERGDLEAMRMPPRYRNQGNKLYVRRSDVERLAASDGWRRQRPN
jgi:excisionase family DNA binding protein